MLGAVEIINGKANRWSFPTQTDSSGRGVEWTDPGEKYLPLDWVIVGEESGTGRRSVNPDYIRKVVSDCKDAGVPVFLKQMNIDGKLVKNPKLDGKEYKEFPDRGNNG
jgi:protein gp37